MRRILTALTMALLLLGFAGCGGTSVQPGDGPAATAEPEPTDPQITEGDPPMEGEPSEEPSEAPAKVANFKEKYVYEDGLQVEVIRIVNSRFTKSQTEYSDEAKAGDPYSKFTVRVKNGSKLTVKLSASATVTYGPDGVEAEKSYLLDDDSGLEGKLLPGRSRSAAAVYLIPPKYYGDVVMEFTPDLDHDSAVFSGSIK
jgi:hypothetical protein